MSGLASVDHIVVFEEDTPLSLIREIAPDVLVKGGDYSAETIVGAEDVVASGGQVVIVPLLAGRSTSAILGAAVRGTDGP
jgi:D-beta-D-heptose 7-phosphate kinase/D-beta-D-heptose 1-phosphate adenosyltransferase